MDVLISLIVVIISKCVCILNHHVVHLYTIFIIHQLYLSKPGEVGKNDVVELSIDLGDC